MGAAQARLSELGSRLKALGWQVQVLTALPNYPTGQIFPGYKHARYVRETVDGLDTIRVSLIPSASRAAFPRLRCYLSFAWSVLRLGRKICDRPDLIYVESPPLFLGPTGEMLARWWRIRYVINISDLWPESFVQMGRLRRSTVIYRMLRKVEIRCYRRAAAVTGQSSDIASSVRSAAPDAEVELITNAVDPLIFGPFRRESARRRELGWEGKCVFMYAGLHGFAQGLDQIIRAASMLQSKPDIHFAFYRRRPNEICSAGDGCQSPECELSPCGGENACGNPPCVRRRSDNHSWRADSWGCALQDLRSYGERRTDCFDGGRRSGRAGSFGRSRPDCVLR